MKHKLESAQKFKDLVVYYEQSANEITAYRSACDHFGVSAKEGLELLNLLNQVSFEPDELDLYKRHRDYVEGA